MLLSPDVLGGLFRPLHFAGPHLQVLGVPRRVHEVGQGSGVLESTRRQVGVAADPSQDVVLALAVLKISTTDNRIDILQTDNQ